MSGRATGLPDGRTGRTTRTNGRAPGRSPSGLARPPDLMPYLVREILLASSAYDAFVLEEDGSLDARMLATFTGLDLPMTPRVVHARTPLEAVTALEERRFDLVIATTHLGETRLPEFARIVAERDPDLPVVLIALTEAELTAANGGAVERAFVWSGDPGLLLALVKLAEDRRNTAHDTRVGDVRVIVVVEGSPRWWSLLLPPLYAELVQQGRLLAADGMNPAHRIARSRARPRVLLATCREQALELIEAYRDSLAAVICDVAFPARGVVDPRAGLHLIAALRESGADVPVLLMSVDEEVATAAKRRGVTFLHKRGAALGQSLRAFLEGSLGFGELVFRSPDGAELGRAIDLRELHAALQTLPAESLEWHARRNDISAWLAARGLFDVARRLHPRRVADFPSVEAMRAYVSEVLGEALQREQRGRIADAGAPEGARPGLVRLGGGSLGGKGRGIAFLHALAAEGRLAGEHLPLEVRVPPAVVLGTGLFDELVESNGLRERLAIRPDAECLAAFMEAPLPETAVAALDHAFAELDGPLAVRSSSLLEDARQHPLAGIYSTWMLPGTDPDPAIRRLELERAVRAVWASTWFATARRARSAHDIQDEERMAVVLQRVVGRSHAGLLYPLASAVALSLDHYPFGPQRPEDGVVSMALGLGHAVVGGGPAVRFSPVHPAVTPSHASLVERVAAGQRRFLALDLERPRVTDWSRPQCTLRELPIEAAEPHGTLTHAASVWCPEDDALREDLRLAGPRAITFRSYLVWRSLPLPEAIASLLECLRTELGGHVEVELALDEEQGEPVLWVLQVRPMGDGGSNGPVMLEPRGARVVARSGRTLGHGVWRLHDMVVVRNDAGLDADGAASVAQTLRATDERLRERGRPYLLVGHGRWGTSDPSQGIPVTWPDVAGASVIVELPLRGAPVEPSGGSHFFHNLVAAGVGYLTLQGPHPDEPPPDPLRWLPDGAQTTEDRVTLVRLRTPLEARIDGGQSAGVLLVPAGVGR